MQCLSKKQPQQGANSKAPQSSVSQHPLRRQPSFYGVTDDIVPIKVDYLLIEQSEGSKAMKHRFVILTDSVLICYDEVENTGQGGTNFQQRVF
jgi:hypothetical protein